MIINYTHHEGTQEQQPREIDTVSSESVVYVRKNIQRITKTTEDGEIKARSYDEAELNHNDYIQFLAEQTAAKADYIAMMVDVDVEEE